MITKNLKNTDKLTKKYLNLLDFIKQNNPNIVFGVVFTAEEGRKHRLWCGTEEVCMFRISLKQEKT